MVDPRPSNQAQPAARRACVLVVDDDPLALAATAAALSFEFDVVATTSAERAADHVARGARYDLILCGLGMPWQRLQRALSRPAPDQAPRVVVSSLHATDLRSGVREHLARLGPRVIA